MPNLPYQTYHAKPNIPNLPCQTSLRRASRWAASSSCWSAVGRRPCGAPPTWSRPATGSSPARCSGGTATRPGAYFKCRLQFVNCEQRGEGKALFYECLFVWDLVNFLQNVVFWRLHRLISYGLFSACHLFMSLFNDILCRMLFASTFHIPKSCVIVIYSEWQTCNLWMSNLHLNICAASYFK